MVFLCNFTRREEVMRRIFWVATPVYPLEINEFQPNKLYVPNIPLSLIPYLKTQNYHEHENSLV